MRVLLVDHDSEGLDAIARAIRGVLELDCVTSKGDAMLLLRQNTYDVLIACERCVDGSGLDLLGRTTRTAVPLKRIFAAAARPPAVVRPATRAVQGAADHQLSHRSRRTVARHRAGDRRTERRNRRHHRTRGARRTRHSRERHHAARADSAAPARAAAEVRQAPPAPAGPALARHRSPRAATVAPPPRAWCNLRRNRHCARRLRHALHPPCVSTHRRSRCAPPRRPCSPFRPCRMPPVPPAPRHGRTTGLDSGSRRRRFRADRRTGPPRRAAQGGR